MEIARAAWSCEALERTIAQCDATIVYPVAVGLVSAVGLGLAAVQLLPLYELSQVKKSPAFVIKLVSR